MKISASGSKAVTTRDHRSRAVVVVEAMAAITLLDMLFASIPSRMDNLIRSLTNKMGHKSPTGDMFRFICY
ncbi:MAG: hypothetical protein ACLR2E_03105 [Lachnospiraceae bacterium]